MTGMGMRIGMEIISRNGSRSRAASAVADPNVLHPRPWTPGPGPDRDDRDDRDNRDDRDDPRTWSR